MEKRNYQRILRDLKVSYTIIAEVDNTPFEFGNSVMIDVSRTGLAMIVDEPIPVPMLLQLQLSVPNRPSGLFLLGKSIYCVPVEDIGMYRIGIKFVGLLPPELDIVLNEFRILQNLSSSS